MRTIQGATLGVLVLLPADQSLTVDDIVVILRESGFPPDKAYYQTVYNSLARHMAAGNVTRTRDPAAAGPWQWKLSDSMREVIPS